MLATWKNLGDDGLTTGDITDGTPAERRPAVSSTRPLPVSLMLFQGRCEAAPWRENSLGCGCSMGAGVKAGCVENSAGVDPA